MGSVFHPCVISDNKRETPGARKPERDLFGCGWGGDEHWLETQSSVEGDHCEESWGKP